jgi:hypothetical protein
MEHKLVPEGCWPGVIKEAEMRTTKISLRPFIQVKVETTHGFVWLNLIPWPEVRWRYKAELEALGVDTQVYLEWDGVDLAEEMAEALTHVLPDRWCYVYVKHREFRGQRRAQASLV